MQLPKIAYILQDFAIGGIETCLYNIAYALQGKFEFHFIATHVPQIEPKFHSMGQAVYISSWRNLVQYLRQNRFNLVQTHNLREYVDCAMAAGVPLIVERVAGNRAASNPKEGVDWVIASNYGTLPLIEKTISLSHVTVIYNGVNVEHINSFQPNRLGFTADDVIVGRLSRLGRGQNIPMLIRAMIEINRGYPQAKLVIVGGASRMPGAENVLPELLELSRPLGKNVIFTGEIDQPYAIINGFDIAVCVSEHEGIPNSLIEPMACGKPVVSTAVGQVAELVEDGLNGLLVPSNDTEALIQALKKLITNPSLRAQLGWNAKQTIYEKFNLCIQAQCYAELYHWLLSDGHRKGQKTDEIFRKSLLDNLKVCARLLRQWHQPSLIQAILPYILRSCLRT